MSDEPHVLEQSAKLPTVPPASAPWDLTGSGYIVALWMPREVIERQSFLPPALAASHRGRLALMMFVDYHAAPCGAYRELLYLPGPMRFHAQSARSITRAFVSTYDSAVNGRRNWGIPKDRADFHVDHDQDGTEHIRVTHQGHAFAQFTLQAKGPALPFNAALIPRFMRTLAQHWQGQEYVYTPKASGSVQWATMRQARFDPIYFPDLAQGKVLAAIKARHFSMRFEPARITPIAAPCPAQTR